MRIGIVCIQCDPLDLTGFAIQTLERFDIRPLPERDGLPQLGVIDDCISRILLVDHEKPFFLVGILKECHQHPRWHAVGL